MVISLFYTFDAQRSLFSDYIEKYRLSTSRDAVRISEPHLGAGNCGEGHKFSSGLTAKLLVKTQLRSNCRIVMSHPQFP
jgi:hypothetical protein